jgi:RNA recognition motif-containing protein
MTTLYVGNLPFSATEAEIRGAFEQCGKVDSVKLINDRETGRPRGFAFVDMPVTDAQAALEKMNGFQMGGRTLRVNEARERAPRAARSDGSGGDRRW